VRRGYFVEGLAGAQFALPEAVERLRAARDDPDAPFVVMAASDPANIYNLAPSPLEPARERDPLTRPRGSGAILVTRRGSVVLAAEGRGRRIRFARDLDDEVLFGAISALIAYLAIGGNEDRRRLRTLETIDGQPAATSPRVGVFRRAGFRLGGMELDWP
jgi:ATP-dependent Lhr-like helicase